MSPVTIRVKKCHKGYKVQQQLHPDSTFGNIAHAVWPSKEQAVHYAKQILWAGDMLVVCDN